MTATEPTVTAAALVPPRPWPVVHRVTLDRPVPAAARVPVAVAAHRALVAIVSDGQPGAAPPLLTGRHGDLPPRERPSHNVTLQPLGRALLIGVPDHADTVLRGRINDGVAQLHTLHTPGGSWRCHRHTVIPDGDVWSAATGAWETVLVPDRRPRRGWTLTDQTLLAVGYVWRDHLIPDRDAHRGTNDLDRALRDAAQAAGVVVEDADPVTDGIRRVHHTRRRDGAPTRPHRARIHLGTLDPGAGLVAIGQSRHLGGGLLVPSRAGLLS